GSAKHIRCRQRGRLTRYKQLQALELNSLWGEPRVVPLPKCSSSRLGKQMRGDLVLPGFRTLPLSMLEQPSLELRAWTQADGPDGRVRALWAGGEQVGLVRQAPLPAPAWLGWLARRTLYVY